MQGELSGSAGFFQLPPVRGDTHTVSRGGWKVLTIDLQKECPSPARRGFVAGPSRAKENQSLYLCRGFSRTKTLAVLTMEASQRMPKEPLPSARTLQEFREDQIVFSRRIKKTVEKIENLEDY